ncbi:MAG: rhomboid family intramembrane serine protease [Sphingobacteriales bacterium]|nr:MAG: rhomboid family intramembrane serine protease [Sphingobacteriales bacterium]
MQNWMLNPFNFVHEKRYQTVITSGFIHGDWAHLFMNMLTFYFFAFPLEEYMVALSGQMGHFIFLFIYLASMVLADISSIIKHKNDPGYNSLGASGAIAAVMFAFILFEPTSTLMMMFFPIPIPAPIFAVLYMVYSIYSGKANRDNVNHEAHLYGALAGLILTIAFFPGIVPYFFEQLPHIFD